MAYRCARTVLGFLLSASLRLVTPCPLLLGSILGSLFLDLPLLLTLGFGLALSLACKFLALRARERAVRQEWVHEERRCGVCAACW